MATAFRLMARKGLKFMTPETVEAMAKDYEDDKDIANQYVSECLKGHEVSNVTRAKISKANKGKASPWKGKHLSRQK